MNEWYAVYYFSLLKIFDIVYFYIQTRECEACKVSHLLFIFFSKFLYFDYFYFRYCHQLPTLRKPMQMDKMKNKNLYKI